MIAHLNLRRNLAALYTAIGAHAFAFYGLYNTLVLWLISLGLPKSQASSRFGAFVFAAYVTPMLGGWISTHTGLRPVAIVGAATALLPTSGVVFLPFADEPEPITFSAIWSPSNRSATLKNLLCLASHMGQIARTD